MTPHKTLSKKEVVQKPITFPDLQKLYYRLSLKKKICLLEKILGNSLWSSIALERNYYIEHKKK